MYIPHAYKIQALINFNIHLEEKENMLRRNNEN